MQNAHGDLTIASLSIMKLQLALATLFITLLAGAAFAQASSGPTKGSLVISGGDLRKDVIERFVNLAGGPDAEFVYIPTAASSIKLPSGFIFDPPNTDTSAPNMREFEQELLKLFGVKHLTVLHTRDRNVANSENFVRPLAAAKGV